jgi:[protein-PII] uridylyltransferase
MKTQPAKIDKKNSPFSMFGDPSTPLSKQTVRQLNEKRNDLNRRFLSHQETENPETFSDILDDYFRNSFGSSESGFKLDLINNPYAIIATGSYGRREVSRKPDISILFIFKDSIPKGAVGLIREIVYPLWDLGFNINHSTKTVKDCITTAAKDFETLTALINARFICGVSPLYSRLMNQLRKKIVFTRKKDILSFLYDRDFERHDKHAGTDFLLEPDLVSSPGGLKDYHAIMSAARIAMGMIEEREIEYEGLLSTEEYKGLHESLDFIRKTLRFIHVSADRTQSRLRLAVQHKTARFMGYDNDKGRNAVDLFLSDISRHMKRVQNIRELFFLNLIPEKTVPANLRDMDAKTGSKWVNLSKGLASFTSSVKIKKHPELLLNVFLESMNLGAPLNPEARRLVHEFLFLIDEAYLGNPEMTDLFEEVLFASQPGSNVPETMAETGIISAFIPEFERTVHRKDFGNHPAYPLDRHLLLTLDHLKALLASHGTKVPNLSDFQRRALLWAGFFHDLGKALAPKNHEKTGAAEISKILSRFHKDEDFIQSVSYLVENHHRMQQMVESENITAPDAVRSFARGFESNEQLTLFYYLTLANLKAKGIGNINDFIEADLSLLYDTCMGGPERFRPSSSALPAAYAPDSLQKVRALGSRTKGSPCLHVLEHRNTRTVTLAYPLGPSSLPGVLAAFLVHNIDIYDLRLIRDSGHQDCLVLRVTTPKDKMFEREKWSELENTLGAFFAGSVSPDDDLKNSMANPGVAIYKQAKIKIYNPADSDVSRIDIQGGKSPLLLYQITRCLTEKGLNVLFLRKGYHKNGSRFLFSVHDKNGNPLSVDEKKMLKAILDHECNR